MLPAAELPIAPVTSWGDLFMSSKLSRKEPAQQNSIPSATPSNAMPASARSSQSAPIARRIHETHQRIYVAILEHRLQPGTKLAEERLADIFGVSRAKVREVLARLAHEQIVELIRNAARTSPRLDRAGARRVRGAAADRAGGAAGGGSDSTPERVARLRQHLGNGNSMPAAATRSRAVIRLSASSTRWPPSWPAPSALARTMRELCMPTCLTIFLYATCRRQPVAAATSTRSSSTQSPSATAAC